MVSTVRPLAWTARVRQPQVLTYSLSKCVGEEPSFDEGLWRSEWAAREQAFWAAHARRDVDQAWEQLEACLVRAHGVDAKRPRARIALQDAHLRTLYGGDAESARLSMCSKRKRRLQQLRVMMGHPGRARCGMSFAMSSP